MEILEKNLFILIKILLLNLRCKDTKSNKYYTIFFKYVNHFDFLTARMAHYIHVYFDFLTAWFLKAIKPKARVSVNY